jgi:hypothetical protein
MNAVKDALTGIELQKRYEFSESEDRTIGSRAASRSLPKSRHRRRPQAQARDPMTDTNTNTVCIVAWRNDDAHP